MGTKYFSEVLGTRILYSEKFKFVFMWPMHKDLRMNRETLIKNQLNIILKQLLFGTEIMFTFKVRENSESLFFINNLINV